MHNWFECKVAYEKNDDGNQKKVKEPYLVDALSFTEAEARIIEEMRSFASGDIIVTDIKRTRFYETFFNDSGDRYYKVKITLIVPDEETGTEKRTTVTALAQASSLLDAVSVVNDGMKGTLVDYEIAAVNETALFDVFPFTPKEEKTKEDEK